METRYINYKSDFVIRERFRDGTGKVVALPDVDFELRYWTGNSYRVTASREHGVFTGCVPDGDAILVIFKDHGLGEGKLHHELHLAHDNPLFADGIQNVYYPEDMHILLWDKMGSIEGVIESDCVAAYTRGYKFEWSDFTAANIKELQRPATEAAEKCVKTVSDFVQTSINQVDDAVAKANTATDNADQATAAAQEATRKADTATKNADAATAEAKKATAAATTATTDSKAQTEQAKAATQSAEEWAGKAKAATTESQKQTKEAKTATDYANQSGQRAASAAEQLEATRGEMETVVGRAQSVLAGVPTGLKVDVPKEVTLGNPVKQYIRAQVKPGGVRQNVIYQGDGKAADIEPDGEIVAKQTGNSRVHVIPTEGTQYYKTIQVNVVAPHIRMAGKGIRLDKSGNIRLT